MSLSRLSNSEDYCRDLKKTKKDVKKAKGSEKWKKVMSKTIDTLIKVETKFDELKSISQHFDAIDSLREKIHEVEKSARLTNADIDYLVKFMNEDKKALVAGKFDEYKFLVQGFEPSLKQFKQLKEESANLRKPFTVSEKTNKAILELNEAYSKISSEFKAVEEQMMALNIGDILITNLIKTSFADRVTLINQVSKGLAKVATENLDVLDQLIDAIVAKANFGISQFKQIQQVKAAIDNKQANAANQYAFMNGTANSAATGATAQSEKRAVPTKVK